MNRDSLEIFQRMHYVCFRYEFEHTGFDPMSNATPAEAFLCRLGPQSARDRPAA